MISKKEVNHRCLWKRTDYDIWPKEGTVDLAEILKPQITT